MTTKTFKRNELKYFITQIQYETICNKIAEHMVLDEFCKDGKGYVIYNIYFDTQNNAVIRHSLDKPFYKEKLRLRSYSMPTKDSDTVFLELKKKIGGTVAKRRAVMHYSEAMELVNIGVIPETDNYQDAQVILEILDFLRNNIVTPKVYISYERVAYFDIADSDFRVSFDQNILTRRTDVDLVSGDYGTDLLTGDKILMEIKCRGSIKLWLCRLLSEMNIYSSGFSKYGSEYKQFINFSTKHEVA